MRAPETVRAASSPEEFTEAVIARLFRGITLTATQAVAARAEIARIADQQAQLDLHRPGAWGRLLRLNAERNAALAPLLWTDADKALLEENAAEAQLEQAQVAWRTQTVDTAGGPEVAVRAAVRSQ